MINATKDMRKMTEAKITAKPFKGLRGVAGVPEGKGV